MRCLWKPTLQLRRYSLRPQRIEDFASLQKHEVSCSCSLSLAELTARAALYLSLKNNPDQNFLVYRIQLLNGTSGHRSIREEFATESILLWLEKNGYANFAYRKLSFDYSSLGMMPTRLGF